MTKNITALPVAWFREADFGRIREMCDDEMIPTFSEWEAKMAKFIANLPPGIRAEKVIINPDDLRAFARRPDDLRAFARRIGATTIDTKVRAKLAGVIFEAQQRRTE